ncbi:hypothetical protein KPL55_17960 [Clostridium lacusfryxellense]|nr:hypothetical protein [Clostridium lacusfryxellense]
MNLIGCDGLEEITAQNLSKNAGTIASEMLSRLGNRLERVIL